MKALAKEKDLLEREKWELRRQAKQATDHATALRSQLDLKDNRMKELEAELAMVRPRPFAHTGWVGHLPEVMSRSGSRRCWETRLAGGFTWEPGGTGLRRGAGPGMLCFFFISTTQPSICLPGARHVGMLRDHPLTLGRKNTKKLIMVISG